jgi:hypothetical protein
MAAGRAAAGASTSTPRRVEPPLGHVPAVRNVSGNAAPGLVERGREWNEAPHRHLDISVPAGMMAIAKARTGLHCPPRETGDAAAAAHAGCSMGAWHRSAPYTIDGRAGARLPPRRLVSPRRCLGYGAMGSSGVRPAVPGHRGNSCAARTRTRTCRGLRLAGASASHFRAAMLVEAAFIPTYNFVRVYQNVFGDRRPARRVRGDPVVADRIETPTTTVVDATRADGAPWPSLLGRRSDRGTNPRNRRRAIAYAGTKSRGRATDPPSRNCGAASARRPPAGSSGRGQRATIAEISPDRFRDGRPWRSSARRPSGTGAPENDVRAP